MLSMLMLLRLMSLADMLLPLPMLLSEDPIELIELKLDIVLNVLIELALLTVESTDSTVVSDKP